VRANEEVSAMAEQQTQKINEAARIFSETFVES
jgi:hypothetical protein